MCHCAPKQKVIKSLFCWYLGRMRSISLWAKNQRAHRSFVTGVETKGGSRDESDVNRKTFSSAKETWVRHYQPRPSVTHNLWTMSHYGALIDGLTMNWGKVQVCGCLCAEEWRRSRMISGKAVIHGRCIVPAEFEGNSLSYPYAWIFCDCPHPASVLFHSRTGLA